MKTCSVVAQAVCSEFNISNISAFYGINRKLKWEEPLILKWQTITKYGVNEDSLVYIYYFGVVVFINFKREEMQNFVNDIKNIPNSIKSKNIDMRYDCFEDFKIEIDETQEEGLEYVVLKVRALESYHLDMTALVVAKSVALEAIELSTDLVFDQVEEILNYFKIGKVNISDKKVAKIIGKILAFKNTTISYILLLDKPAVAWKNEKAEELFNELADLFELNDRYEKLSAKSQVLLDTTEVFSNLSQSRRGTILEIIVIILILIEVLHAFEQPLLNLIKGILGG